MEEKEYIAKKLKEFKNGRNYQITKTQKNRLIKMFKQEYQSKEIETLLDNQIKENISLIKLIVK